MNHRKWIALSGLIWFAAGGMLLLKGLRLIAEATLKTDTICFRFQETFGSVQQSAFALIATALFIGFLKGRLVFAKTVQRITARILSLPLPIRLAKVYAPSYWILIGTMMGIGLLFRFLPISIDLRGWIDTAIGSALLNGAMLYFRAARNVPA